MILIENKISEWHEADYQIKIDKSLKVRYSLLLLLIPAILLMTYQVLSAQEIKIENEPYKANYALLMDGASLYASSTSIADKAIGNYHASEEIRRNSIQKSVRIGGLSGGILGVILSLTVWDGETACNPLDPFCGAFSKEVFKVNAPSMILNGALGATVGAGTGFMIGLGSRSADGRDTKPVALGIAMPAGKKVLMSKPALSLRVSLWGSKSASHNHR